MTNTTEPEVVVDNYAELKHYMSGYLVLIKLKELLYFTTIRVIEEEPKKKE